MTYASVEQNRAYMRQYMRDRRRAAGVRPLTDYFDQHPQRLGTARIPFGYQRCERCDLLTKYTPCPYCLAELYREAA